MQTTIPLVSPPFQRPRGPETRPSTLSRSQPSRPPRTAPIPTLHARTHPLQSLTLYSRTRLCPRHSLVSLSLFRSYRAVRSFSPPVVLSTKSTFIIFTPLATLPSYSPIHPTSRLKTHCRCDTKSIRVADRLHDGKQRQRHLCLLISSTPTSTPFRLSTPSLVNSKSSCNNRRQIPSSKVTRFSRHCSLCFIDALPLVF